MNNKGTSIVEIMISVVLISIVTVFLFILLSDLKNEDYLSSSKATDSLNRTEYIHIIENKIIDLGLKNMNVYNCSNNLCVDFTYNDSSTGKLKITNKEVIFDDEKWVLSSGSYTLNKAKYYICTNLNGYSFFKLFVPVTEDATNLRKISFDLSYLSKSVFTATESAININGVNILSKCK